MRLASLMFLWVALLVTARGEDIVMDGQLCELIRQPMTEVAKTHPGARLESFNCGSVIGTLVYPAPKQNKVNDKPAPQLSPQPPQPPQPPRLTGRIITYNKQQVELIEMPLARVKLSRPTDRLEAFVTDTGDFTIVLPQLSTPGKPVEVKLARCELLPISRPPVIEEPPILAPVELTIPKPKAMLAKKLLPPVIYEQPTNVSHELPLSKAKRRLPDAFDPPEDLEVVSIKITVPLKPVPPPKPALRRVQTKLANGALIETIYGTMDEVRAMLGASANLQAVVMDGQPCVIVYSGGGSTYAATPREPVSTAAVPCKSG